MNVGIIGVSGYTGIEVYRLLKQHEYVKNINIYSESAAGEILDRRFPHLACDHTKIQAIDYNKMTKDNEVIFLCTPNPVSQEIGQKLTNMNQLFIDLSGAFRLKNEDDHKKYYKMPVNDSKLLSKIDYALADINTNYCKNHAISNPGCYATAAILALAPVVIRQDIDANSMIFDGKSGLTGAGKSLTTSSHYVNVDENMSVYKVNQHQHIPEIIQQFQEWGSSVQGIQFMTSLIPVKRGIMMNAYAKVTSGVSIEQLYSIFEEFYSDSPFVRLQPLGKFPELRQVIGSNYCDIGIAYNEATQTLSSVVVIDNLIKGAAGQAVQNMNKLFDLPEESGLQANILYP